MRTSAEARARPDCPRRALSVIPAQAGIRASRHGSDWLRTAGGRRAALGWVVKLLGYGERWRSRGSCLRRNDGKGAGVAEGSGMGDRGRGTSCGAGSLPLTPRANICPKNIHPSPLPGGRLGGGREVASAHEVVVPGADRPLSRRRRHAAPTPLLVSPLKGGRDELGGAVPRRHSCAGRKPGDHRR